MADLGMGGQLTQSVQNQNNRVKEAERADKKAGIKEREAMAGTKQVEAKFQKEEVTKTEGRFKAYKKAYEYLLGEDPQDQIEEEFEQTKVEEEIEVKKTPQKPTLDEIEKYDVRERFKSKVRFFLGEDFNEDEPYEEEDLISEEKKEDNYLKIDLAKQAYSTLIQYIYDSLGEFDFDRIADLKLLLDYGMPENAIMKFLFLHQMARSGIDFPNTVDISILMYKLEKIDMKKNPQELTEIINADFETLKKLKYAVAGFIYVPLPEVMTKIEEDTTVFFKKQFFNIYNELTDEKFTDIDQNFSQEILLSIRSQLDIKYNEIEKIIKEKKVLDLKLNMPNIKNREELIGKIKAIYLLIDNIKKDIYDFENKIAKMVVLYSFLHLKMKISAYNKNYPLDMIKQLLSTLRVRVSNKNVQKLITERMSIGKLIPKDELTKELPKRNTEIIDSKLKVSIAEFSKLVPLKQQQIIKGIRTNSFELNTTLFWVKQKRLNEFNY